MRWLLVLLVGAGLLMKSLVRLLEVNPGFDTQNLLTLQVSLPPSRYSNLDRNAAFHRELLERIGSVPGVIGAGSIDRTPLSGGGTVGFTVEGRPAPPPGEAPEANTRDVSASYFRAMGIPLLRGRFFTEQDTPHSPLVLIINQTLASRLFPGQDPVGQRLIFRGLPNQPKAEIVGVVGDEKLGSLDDRTTPILYDPILQSNDTDLSLVVRAGSEPHALAAALQDEIHTLDPEVLVDSAITVQQIIATSPSAFARRFPALLIGGFAGLALLLSGVGVYGVISYLVGQRTREIGIRMALGAQRVHILRLVVGEGLRLAVLGVGAGLLAAVVVTRLLASLLFGVSTTDAVIFCGVAALLAAVTLAACCVPAWRASRVDPMVALRYE